MDKNLKILVNHVIHSPSENLLMMNIKVADLNFELKKRGFTSQGGNKVLQKRLEK